MSNGLAEHTLCRSRKGVAGFLVTQDLEQMERVSSTAVRD